MPSLLFIFHVMFFLLHLLFFPFLFVVFTCSLNEKDITRSQPAMDHSIWRQRYILIWRNFEMLANQRLWISWHIKVQLYLRSPLFHLSTYPAKFAVSFSRRLGLTTPNWLMICKIPIRLNKIWYLWSCEIRGNSMKNWYVLINCLMFCFVLFCFLQMWRIELWLTITHRISILRNQFSINYRFPPFKCCVFLLP